jgi:AraC-like DNA-binding protein
MPKAKLSQEEVIRRLREVTADEAEYFPGVLGNPESFATRWGLTTSRVYSRFKKQQKLAERSKEALRKAQEGNGAKPNWVEVVRRAEFSPAKMAALCSISERRLQRIFKRHLKRTPREWLRELQCRLAKQLIEQGYSSKAAAAELSFATDAQLQREFKKIFGFSLKELANAGSRKAATPFHFKPDTELRSQLNEMDKLQRTLSA